LKRGLTVALAAVLLLTGCGTPSTVNKGAGLPSQAYKSAALALTAPADASGTIPVTGTTLRMPVLYGVPLGRVRMHVRNHNDRGDTSYPGAVSFAGVWFGPGDTVTGAHAAPPVKVANGFTTPADGSEWVTPWFDADTAENTGHLLTTSFTAPPGTVAVDSIGTVWTGAGSPAGTAAPGRLSKSVPFDFWLEAEVPASVPVVAELGSSGTAGHGSDRPVLDSALSIYARRVGALPLHYAHSGSTLAIWDEADHHKWQKWQDCARPDALLLSLGSNDLYGSATLGETQAKTAEVLAIARKLATPNLFATTVPPRDSTTDEDRRRAYNTWLLTRPLGIRDVFDWNGALSDDDETIRPEFYGDGVHTNTAGAQAKADAITRPLTPTPPAVGEPGPAGAPDIGKADVEDLATKENAIARARRPNYTGATRHG
jgi:lysophospholipase L1-like esterase